MHQLFKVSLLFYVVIGKIVTYEFLINHIFNFII